MRTLADDKQIADVIDRLAAEVSGTIKPADGPWAFVGLRSRGDVLAHRLAQRLKPQFTGTLDVTLYRDDLDTKWAGPQPMVRTSHIDFPIDGANILLVDDVLMTGRTIRAAMQSLMDFGRPRCVKLLTLIDRGGRELPIAPDFVGLRVNTNGRGDRVEVRLKPADEFDRVTIGAAEDSA
jgi:pyrimidine operon attenuation protein/uracil phosphoribosyltransferase